MSKSNPPIKEIIKPDGLFNFSNRFSKITERKTKFRKKKLK
jgi:hypothetical protein